MRVMIFGTFDGIHEGHRYLFSKAHELAKGGRVMACIAQDSIVMMLKGHAPIRTMKQRVAGVRHHVRHVYRGDARLGPWSKIRIYKPDAILIGYDQMRMKSQLEKDLPVMFPSLEIKLVVCGSYEPELYKSSIINQHVNKEVNHTA